MYVQSLTCVLCSISATPLDCNSLLFCCFVSFFCVTFILSPSASIVHDCNSGRICGCIRYVQDCEGQSRASKAKTSVHTPSQCTFFAHSVQGLRQQTMPYCTSTHQACCWWHV